MHFSQLIPPPKQTARIEPCFFRDAHPSTSCPLAQQCDETCTQTLLYAFGSAFVTTRCEPTSCPVVRSEKSLNRDAAVRLTIRKHIYERLNTELHGAEGPIEFPDHVQQRVLVFARSKCSKLSQTQRNDLLSKLEVTLLSLSRETLTATNITELVVKHGEGAPGLIQDALAYAESLLMHPLRCLRLSADTELGRYLGFIDFRLDSASPVALAIIVPPRHLRHDPSIRVILGDYGHIFGGPSFTGTVFASHDPETSGAQCSQAAVLMAVGLVSDRGGVPMPPLDITLTARTPDKKLGTPPAPGCAIGGPKTSGYRFDGLNWTELKRALKHGALHVSPSFIEPKDVSDGTLCEIIASYVDARSPAILYVHPSILWGKEVNAKGHAVVVIGYSRGSDGQVDSFIVHDPGKGPFDRIDKDRLLKSARAFGKEEGIHCAIVSPSGIRNHLIDCIKDKRETEKDCRYRLMHVSEFQLHRAETKQADFDTDGLCWLWVIQHVDGEQRWIFDASRSRGRMQLVS